LAKGIQVYADIVLNHKLGADEVEQVSAEEFKLLKNYSKTVANQAVKEIKAGNIIPSPLEGNTMCNYCPYAHICLKKANNIKPRAKDEVKISSFEEEK